jgi:hypothetical protein
MTPSWDKIFLKCSRSAGGDLQSGSSDKNLPSKYKALSLNPRTTKKKKVLEG